MVYICADDYGLNDASSARIRQCVECGALNKVSVFPNFGPIDLRGLQNVRLSLHLNLVEGRCMADAGEVDLLADESGAFRHTFGGLLKASLLNRKQFEAQVYRELRAQILHFRAALGPEVPFGIDSHQHTHMIPAVFRALIRVLRDEHIDVPYLRIPAEPLSPYIKTPSLYLTYRPVNLVKQWLLNLLWAINKRVLNRSPIPTADFFGILFSGKMDAARVAKVLPVYIRRAEKRGRDVEVLFHPGYLEANRADFQGRNIVFDSFYLSANRQVEFDCVMKHTEGSVL